MNITIITTEKKLTKSLISQIKYLSLSEMSGEVETLGYLINVVKDANNVALIRLPDGDYRLLSLAWKKELLKSIKRPVRTRNLVRTFSSEIDLDAWWCNYIKIKDKCVSNQIYI